MVDLTLGAAGALLELFAYSRSSVLLIAAGTRRCWTRLRGSPSRGGHTCTLFRPVTLSSPGSIDMCGIPGASLCCLTHPWPGAVAWKSARTRIWVGPLAHLPSFCGGVRRTDLALELRSRIRGFLRERASMDSSPSAVEGKLTHDHGRRPRLTPPQGVWSPRPAGQEISTTMRTPFDPRPLDPVPDPSSGAEAREEPPHAPAEGISGDSTPEADFGCGRGRHVGRRCGRHRRRRNGCRRGRSRRKAPRSLTPICRPAAPRSRPKVKPPRQVQ